MLRFMNTADIRRALLRDLALLREDFDSAAREERRRTRSVGRRAFGRDPRCALCGRDQAVQFAHLFPLEEGGRTTADNLIPLCGGKPELSCHWLYDRRYASVGEMRQARDSWSQGANDPALAERMRERLGQHRRVPTVSGAPGEDMLQSLIALGHFKKCVHQARALADTLGSDPRRRIGYSIREIECQRRRAARGALEQAARRYSEVAPGAEDFPDLLPRLYYEGAYVSLLRGYHRAAKDVFERSQAAAERSTGQNPMIEYWLAADSVVECVVAIQGVASPWTELFARADEAEMALRDVRSTHAQRSIDSWNWDRVRMALMQGDSQSARRFLANAEDHVYSQTALGGWNTSTLAKRLQLRGSVRLMSAESSSDVGAAAETLTRSVVVLVGRGRQYPEGLRDTLFDLATAIDRLGAARHSGMPSRLRAVAEQTLDASSWSHPYRAD